MTGDNSDPRDWLGDVDELTVLDHGNAVFFVLVMLDGTKHGVLVPHKVFGQFIDHLQDLAGIAFEERRKAGIAKGVTPEPSEEPFPAYAIEVGRGASGRAFLLRFSSKDGRRSDIRLPVLLADQLAAELQGKLPDPGTA